MDYENAKKMLEERGQTQLLRFYDTLSSGEQNALLRRICSLDWDILRPSAAQTASDYAPIHGLERAEIEKRRDEFFAAGKQALQKGEVAAVLLAGGQGTRLGFSGPKGAYNIGVRKPLYIFERLFESLKQSSSVGGKTVPLYVMTSEKNHEETLAFFKEHAFFGYPEEEVTLFKQDMAPCTDFEGKIFLEAKDAPAVSPNGNGGWFVSMQKAGLAGEMKKRGVKWCNVFSVDNVLQKIADPLFVGATILSGCKSGSKVVNKTCPEEKVGVLCLKNGLPDIVEYYELTKEMANARDEKGGLLYRSGVILNYLFSLDKLEEIGKVAIPVHKAKKKIAYLDNDGALVLPDGENGYKYERLILDLVRHMGSCLSYEVEREKEFAPVKNLTGVDSVDTARELLQKNGVEF